MILIIKHIDIEGPGILGDVLTERGYDIANISLERGDRFPDKLDAVRAVVVLGGPMNVDETAKYPFLRTEDIFIKKVLERGIPYLGICLGAQLLAKAAGAEVIKDQGEEIGFYDVELTDVGGSDPLFAGLHRHFEVFQWHSDSFLLPRGGELLAGSGACRNQAFKLPSRAYGLQFHLELDARMIDEWIEDYFDPNDNELRVKAAGIKERYARTGDVFTSRGRRMCENFADMIA
ncbi:MAG: type 1 glutamine amidotransferase [Candidatus Omnitrophica bacterium]|nr:type 1 glutamine amidotransferase [Candidatus Omnitrophota bacterium]